MSNRLLAMLAYIGLAWVWVQPSLTTVPGGPRSDVWNSLWSLWFSHQSLMEGHLPWATELLNAPDGGTVLLPDPLAAVFALFAVPALGVAGAYTALMLLRLAAAGLIAHMFAEDWLKETGLAPDAAGRAAWVAGIGYATAPVLLAGLQCGTTEAVSGAWPALTAWLCWRASVHGGRRAGVLAAVALLGAALSSWYAAVVAFIFAGLMLLGTPGKRRPGPLLAGLVFVIPLAIFTQLTHTDPTHMGTRSPEILTKIRETFGAADLLNFVWPTAEANLAIFSPAERGQGYLHTTYLGAALLLGAVVALVRGAPQARLLALAGGLCALLALGPVLHLNGEQVLDWMPYALLEGSPGFDGLSLLWRLSVGAALAVALLAAAATRGHRLVVILGVGLVLAEAGLVSPLSSGIARTSVQPSAALGVLADAPAGAVLTVPAFRHHSDLWLQTQHGKPTTGDINHRRSPAAKAWLQQARRRPLSELQAAAEAAGIRYLIVHQEPSLRNTPDRKLVEALTAQGAVLAEDSQLTVLALW
jgi:hypothetical protein